MATLLEDGRRAGWNINNKRIRRLWRAEGLRVPQGREKKRLTGIGINVSLRVVAASLTTYLCDDLAHSDHGCIRATR